MLFSVEEILIEIKNRKPFLLIDSEDRENEADLIMPAEFITKEVINFMISNCKGVICVPITKQLAEKLELETLKRRNTKNSAYFTTSVEAKTGVTTGISAADRAHTINCLTKDDITPDDFVTPGHVFPLIIREKGLEERQGHTEGGATLVKLAGLKPITVVCEILDDNGDSAKMDFLEEFAKERNLKIITMKELCNYLHGNNLKITF